jgi:hypothetical protein
MLKNEEACYFVCKEHIVRENTIVEEGIYYVSRVWK